MDSSTSVPPLGIDNIIVGGGEMGARMRALDWSATLGPVERWPQSLRSAISILLPSRAQIILFWGPDFITLYNDAYRPVFGGKHPWALGRPARECWSEIRDVLGPLLEGVVRTGEPFWAQDHPFFIERHGYREETYFDVSYDPVRVEDGSVGGVFCIVSETTGRVLGERRLRTLRELGVRTSEATTVVDVCREAASALAIDAADITFSLSYLIEGDGRRARLAAAGGVDATAAWGGGTLDVLPGDPLAAVIGDRRTVVLPAAAFLTTLEAPSTHVLVSPLTSADRMAGFLVVGLSRAQRLEGHYRDFLDLVAARVSAAIGHAQAYEAERRRTEALAELDRAKTAFFSNVSHEFRTPLTLMLAPLEGALRWPALQDDQRETLRLVERNGLRLLKLVNTLLDFSRIEAGRAQATFTPTELGETTAELTSVFRAAVEAAGLRLHVDCPPLKEAIWVDREMWEKIVLNLLSNALKFTFEGEIRVRLVAGEDRVMLHVEDTGVGIPAAELPHVFERFHRVRGARARSHEGTGIGLALVRELLTLHGGTIAVESEVDRGTRFTVTLRRGTAHLDPDRLAPAALHGDTRGVATGVATSYVAEAVRWIPDEITLGDTTDPSGDGDMARILVADDNADMREYLRRLLAGRWIVDVVPDGAVALRALRERPYDVLLTDVMMPALDGFGLVAAVRNDQTLRTLPVIVLSARAGEESRVAGLEHGADDYLVKPFSARELLARVNAQLALAARRRETTDALRATSRRLEHSVDTERSLRTAAEAANRAKDDFLAMLAHELRNPLAVIVNGIGVLERMDSGAEEPARIRALIKRQANHLARLLDDLLDVARISQGKITLRREIVDLRAVVDLAIDSERHRLNAKRQRLRVEAAPGPTHVHGDPARLQQIVSNLLNNASKYTAAEGAIAVELTSEAGHATLTVRDNGAGIPADKLASIFDLFFQLETPLARSEGGLGIGLTLVHRLVDQHGGTVTAASPGVGRGSTFVVTLPLAQAPRESATAAAPAAHVPCHVLLIEDNDDAREALRAGLELAGHRVTVAADGASGIDRAMTVQPDVAVVDVGLPGVDGYDVARRLREKFGRDIVLVALTGYSQPEDRRRALDAGFDVHLPKPAGVDDLARVLNRPAD